MTAATVLIPTIGRSAHLRQCLESLRCGTRPPDEILIVAQGEHASVAALIDEFGDLPIRVLEDDGRGRGRALNVGLRTIGDGAVLITDDDCRVRADWLETGLRELHERPNALVTGRVLTQGDLSRVPALRLDPIACDYAGPAGFGKLTGGNIAVRLADIMSLGGFDERIVPGCEDNEFGWRWLKSGRIVRYEPELVIWHDDWRGEEELRAVYRSYGTGQAAFYAKHLAKRDPWIAYYVTRDLVAGARMVVRTLAKGRSVRSDVHLAFFPALVKALLWRDRSPPRARAASAAPARRASCVPVGGGASRSLATQSVPVIITTRNRRSHVVPAVASAFAQTATVDVLVMDDGSSDGTAEALRARFPAVRVVRTEHSIGPCEQRNRAMAMVDADIVVMMDDDAYFPSPSTIEQSLAAFDHPRVAVATIPYLNARRENVLRYEPPPDARAHASGVFVGVAAAFRRDAFQAVGGYESRLLLRGEEGDLALRLVGAGYAIAMSRADPVVHWEASPVKPKSAFFLTARNEVLLTVLRVPRRQLARRLAEVSMRQVLHGVAKRRVGTVVCGLHAGYGAAWAARAERRPVAPWAYGLARSLRRTGPAPMAGVLRVLQHHTPTP